MSTDAAYIHRFSDDLRVAVHDFVDEWEDRTGARLKLDPGTESGIVLTRDGEVAGFATADAFGGDDLETAVAVDDAADWELIRPVAQAHARTVGARWILLIVDPRDAVMRASVADAVPRQVELRYGLGAEDFRLGPGARALTSLTIRGAEDFDVPFITRLEVDAFGRSDPRFVDDELPNTRLVLANESPVGKVRIERSGSEAGLYGVVIDRSVRGMGIGTAALALVIQSLIDEGAARVFLEVDAGNAAAIHVYEALGFRREAEFRYYGLPAD